MCVFTGCGVFGRDEGDSEFSFTQQEVDALIQNWSQVVRAVGFHKTTKPTSSTIMVVELCISDRNKPLLLKNCSFIPYVVDALLLVRAELKHLYVRPISPSCDDCCAAPTILTRIQSTPEQA